MFIAPLCMSWWLHLEKHNSCFSSTFAILGLKGEDFYRNGVADMYFTRPPRWCELVHLFRQLAGYLFSRQNHSCLLHPRLQRASLLASVRPWLRGALLFLQSLRTVPGLLLHRCYHGGVADGQRRNRGRFGTSRQKPRQGVCVLARLSAPGLRSVWWHIGTVGFHIQIFAEVCVKTRKYKIL